MISKKHLDKNDKYISTKSKSKLRFFHLFLVSFFIFYTSTICFANQQANNPTGKQQPVFGDILVTSMLGEPSNLIPYFSSDQFSHEVGSLFYVAPLRYNKDMNIEPWAAESFEVLDDGLLLRFTLRKGILWEDGVELTADDMEFTYLMMIDPNTPTAYSGDFQAVKKFVKLDKYSFEVHYEKPFARSLTTWMHVILPKHALEGQDLRSTPLARKPLSCGPYTLKEWLPASMITLEANPNYFEGRPFFDQRIFRVISDISTMFLELKAGKIDIMPSLTPQQYLFQTNSKEFKQNFNVYKDISRTYSFMGYNLRNPLFSDIKVRKAIAHAINKDDIIKGALLGQGTRTIGPYKPETWVYNDKIEDYRFDVKASLELLKEAGWTQNTEGQLVKDGKPFSFTLLTNQGNETRIKIALIIQSQLAKLGIEVKVRTVEWAAFIKNFISTGYFDAIILSWNILEDPDVFDVWHSSRAGGTLNFINYQNPEVDSLLEQARSTLDQDKRKKLYDRFQEILHEEQPYCFLYVPYSISAVSNRFEGIDPAAAGVFHNLDQWWVPLAKQKYRKQ